MAYATKHREAKPRFVKKEIGTRETLLSSTPLMTETCYGWLGKIFLLRVMKFLRSFKRKTTMHAVRIFQLCLC